MRVEDFLEKNEVREMTIFNQLVLNKGVVTFADLLDDLSISKASLEKDIDSLTDRIQVFNGQVSILYDGKTIELAMSDELSLQHIRRMYLSQSIKIAIINFLFKHQEFSITQLTQELAISESSLFRKIKDLNKHLKPFGIKIRNGQMQGEELQIRYFYFQFYRYIDNQSSLQAENGVNQMIQAMEKFLSVNIPSDNRQRLITWFTISRFRMNVKEKTHNDLRSKMKPYMTDSFYRKLQVFILRYFSRYAVEVDEVEAMIHFSFLLSFPIMNEEDFHEYKLIRNRHAPIAAADTFIVETIINHFKFRRLPYMLEREIAYHLTHIHTRLYFFQGDIEIYDYDEILSKERELIGKNLVSFARRLLDISCDMLETQAKEKGDGHKMEVLKYTSLLILISLKMTSVIHIGIDLKMDSIYKETLSELLMLRIRPINGVLIERYEAGKDYDLILTNRAPLENNYYDGARLYLLSEIMSSFDMENIQNIIQELNH